MATPTNVHRKGGDLAFISDGHQGNPTLAVRDRLIGEGHKEDTGDTSRIKWGVVGEPLTLSHNVAGGVGASASESVKHTFQRRRPEKRRFSIMVPINGSVDSSEGVVAFNCPTDRSFEVVGISENHQVLEATAAECNLQVEITPDAIAVQGAGVRKMLTPNEIDVETEGISLNTSTEVRLEKGTPARVVGSQYLITTTTLDDGQVLFNVPVGKSYKLLSATVQFTTVPAATDAVPISIKKLAATDVAGTLATGTQMATLDLSPSGTELADETVHTLVLDPVNANLLLAAGERLAYEINAGGTPAAGADMLLSWILEETTVGITGSFIGHNVIHPNERVSVYFEQDDGLTVQDTTEYRGNVTVTLQEVEAEKHQEQLIPVHLSDEDNLATTGICVFTASEHRWKVTSVQESHAVVDGNAGAIEMRVVKATGTETAATGTIVVDDAGSGLDLKSTINTVQTGTIITAGSVDILEEGDRLILVGGIAGTETALGTYDGVTRIIVAPELSTPSTAKIFSYPIEKAVLVAGADLFIAEQDYRVLGFSFTPVIADATGASTALMFERLADGQAVEAGVDLNVLADFDAQGAVDTVQHVVPIAANAIVAAGERIAVHATLVGADTAKATVALRGGVTLFLEPINDAQGTLQSAFIYTNETGKVMRVSEIAAIWEKAETHATTLNVQVQRIQGTERIGAGDNLVAATNINVKGTVNTRTTGTIQTGSDRDELAAGDRLAVVFHNDAATRVNPGDLDGLEVTARLTAVADAGSPASEGVLFSNKTGRPIELRGAFASWDVPEADAATLNLNFERLLVNVAGGAGSGTLLNGLTDIDVKGADDTAGSITPVTTIAIRAGVLSTGSGQDDITAGGTFVAPSGFSGRTVFTFTVDSTGTTDTFTTTRDGKVLQRKQDMATAAISIRLGDGVTVLWASVTGHTLDDVWTVVVSRNTILEDGDRLGYFFDVDAGGTVTTPTELDGLNIIYQLVPTTLKVASTT